MERREPRAREIVTIAATLFAQKGFEATSLQNIADAAGIRKSSLYAHIPSKEHLLHTIFEDYIDRMLDEAQTILASDERPLAKLRAVIRALYAAIDEFKPHVTVFFEEMRYLELESFANVRDKRDGYERIVVAILREGIEAGDFRPVNSRVVTYHLAGMTGWAYRWYKPDGPLDLDGLTELTLDLVINGIGSRSNDG